MTNRQATYSVIDFKRTHHSYPGNGPLNTDSILLLLLKTSIATLILAIGMTAVTDDIVYLWRRPVLLIKSIIAMYLVMLIAANARDQHALELVVAYLLASAAVSIPYVLWIRNHRERE